MVTVLLVVVVVGGYVVAGALGGRGTPDFGGGPGLPGEPIAVGQGVSIRPPQGWTVDQDRSQPGTSVLLTKGPAIALVQLAPGDGLDPGMVLENYVDQVIAPQALDVSVSEPQPIQLSSGLGAERQSYVGTFQEAPSPLEGDITGLTGPGGTGVIIDGWTPEGQFLTYAGEIHAMADTAEVA